MRLTHEEIETIRIHINAFKERLCNQERWKEAEEYQKIIDKLDDILLAESVVHCKECAHCRTYYHGENMPFSYGCDVLYLSSIGSEDYCSRAKRREEE